MAMEYLCETVASAPTAMPNTDPELLELAPTDTEESFALDPEPTATPPLPTEGEVAVIVALWPIAVPYITELLEYPIVIA